MRSCKVINFCRCHHPDRYKHLENEVFETDEQLQLRKNDYRRTTFERIENNALKAQVTRMANYADQAFVEDLQDKQTRLNNLLVTEDDTYEKQYTGYVKDKIEQEIQDRVNKNMAIKEQKEREKAEFKRKKMLQYHMMNCDEIRIPLRQKLLEDSKRCQLEQIKDKIKQQEMERDRTYMWKEIGIRRYNSLLKDEEFKANHARLLNRCTAEVLQEQIKQNQLKRLEEDREIEEEKKRNQQALQDALRRDQEESDARQKRGEKVAKELKEQLQVQEEKQRILAQQAAQINKIFAESTKREIEKESTGRAAGLATFKKETFMYLDYLKQIRNEKAQQDAEVAQIVENDRLKYLEAMQAKSMEVKQRNKANAVATFNFQKQQLEYAEHERERLKAKQLQEEKDANEIYRKNRELAEDAEKRRRQSSLCYGAALKQQCKHQEMLALKEKQYQEKFDNEVLEYNSKCLKAALDVVGTSVDYLPLHPHLAQMDLGLCDANTHKYIHNTRFT